jgi:predicted GNAT family acetyltransferase
VYTPPEHRRQGYGTAATAALSRMLMTERGYRTCFLYTDLSNPISNGIYSAIGYRPVCEMLEIRFE